MPRYQIYGASPPFSLRSLALLTIIVSALTAGIAAPALSQGAVLNIATGASDGRYAEACTQLADDVRGSLTINCLPSPGAEANLKRLSGMEVRDAKNQVLPPAEGAIIQGDTIPYFLKTYPGKLRVNRVSPLFPEAFQLVCNTDAGVSYIKDLYGKNKLLAAGGAGTGTKITWDNFISAEKRYADVALSPLSGPFAVNATKSGEVACTAFVASPGYGSIRTLNEQSTGNLVLVTANDGDLIKPRDELGRPLYRWGKVQKSVYPALMKDYWGAADVVVQDSWLVVTKQWAESNEDAYRQLSASASRKAREWGAGK